MKTSYILLAFIGILIYNAILANRDAKMFEAYDKMFQAYNKMCTEQPANPNCIYAK